MKAHVDLRHLALDDALSLVLELLQSLNQVEVMLPECFTSNSIEKGKLQM